MNILNIDIKIAKKFYENSSSSEKNRVRKVINYAMMQNDIIEKYLTGEIGTLPTVNWQIEELINRVKNLVDYKEEIKLAEVNDSIYSLILGVGDKEDNDSIYNENGFSTNDIITSTYTKLVEEEVNKTLEKWKNTPKLSDNEECMSSEEFLKALNKSVLQKEIANIIDVKE